METISSTNYYHVNGILGRVSTLFCRQKETRIKRKEEKKKKDRHQKPKMQISSKTNSHFSKSKKPSYNLEQPVCLSYVLICKWKSFLIFTLLISLISTLELIDNNIGLLLRLPQHLCIFAQVSRVGIVHISLIHLPVLVKSPDKISSP